MVPYLSHTIEKHTDQNTLKLQTLFKMLLYSLLLQLGTSPPPLHFPIPDAQHFSSGRFNDEDICTCPEASVTRQFSSVSWNSFSRQVLRALYDSAPISMHCNKSSAIRFPVGRPSGETWGILGPAWALLITWHGAESGLSWRSLDGLF